MSDQAERDVMSRRHPAARRMWITKLVCATLALCAGAAQAQTAMHTKRIADGVWAVLQPAERRFDDANSIVILVDDGVLVVDTQVSPIGATAVLAEIRRLTDRPVKWVLNTHWHGDHVQGNEVYRDSFPDAVFIVHASVADDMRSRAMPAHAQDLVLPTRGPSMTR